MTEHWKPITGYESYYSISNYGRVMAHERHVTDVRHTKHIKGGLKKPVLRNNGYFAVSLFVGGKEKSFLVHRLVAIHFIANTDSYPFVNHKDSNKLNNHHSNLEWCTNKQNLHHAKAAGKLPMGETHHLAKTSDSEIREIRKLYESGKHNQTQLAKMFSITQSQVSRFITRTRRGARCA